jgi:hypothetical protein
MQLDNVVILSINLTKLLQSFNATQAGEPIAWYIDGFKVGQLVDILRQLNQAHSTQVYLAFISTLGVPNLKFDVTHSCFNL